ncbi:MAG: 3-dehydroquinate synthase [Bacteroidales bacterium]|nr:3-dehydroquinate synthase [Bacteroidales bacterium]
MNDSLFVLDAKPVSYAIGEGALDFSAKNLEQFKQAIILVDEHVEKYCLPVFREKLPLFSYQGVIRIQSGEEQKNLDQTIHIWDELTRMQVDRDSLLVILGGGVVSDIGGFAASTFKRGIKFINFPTTLLGMVDAAIGGKTGIDFGNFKNQVGLFSDPCSVVVDPVFLDTLEDIQWQSGFAEVLKYGLIMDRELWRLMLGKHYREIDQWNKIIIRAARDKIDIVRHDALEKGLRKNLNFGHTIGHAIESYFLKSGHPVTHGKAIAAGMICEAWLSSRIYEFECNRLSEIVEMIDINFRRFDLDEAVVPELLDLMRQDKKVRDGKLRFSLLRKLGKAVHDIEVDMNLVRESVQFYIERKKCS